MPCPNVSERALGGFMIRGTFMSWTNHQSNVHSFWLYVKGISFHLSITNWTHWSAPTTAVTQYTSRRWIRIELLLMNRKDSQVHQENQRFAYSCFQFNVETRFFFLEGRATWEPNWVARRSPNSKPNSRVFDSSHTRYAIYFFWAPMNPWTIVKKILNTIMYILLIIGSKSSPINANCNKCYHRELNSCPFWILLI